MGLKQWLGEATVAATMPWIKQHLPPHSDPPGSHEVNASSALALGGGEYRSLACLTNTVGVEHRPHHVNLMFNPDFDEPRTRE
jgi:hypothetical protein